MANSRSTFFTKRNFFRPLSELFGEDRDPDIALAVGELTFRSAPAEELEQLYTCTFSDHARVENSCQVVHATEPRTTTADPDVSCPLTE